MWWMQGSPEYVVSQVAKLSGMLGSVSWLMKVGGASLNQEVSGSILRRPTSRSRSVRMRRATVALSVMLAAPTLAGCSASPDVRLRNPQTGQIFTCSGEAGTTGRRWDEMAKGPRANCVQGLEGRGDALNKKSR